MGGQEERMNLGTWSVRDACSSSREGVQEVPGTVALSHLCRSS